MTDRTLAIWNTDGTPALPAAGLFGSVVSGSQAAVQLFLYELLTPYGEAPGRTGGSRFGASLANANTALDLGAAFSADAEDALLAVKRAAAAAGDLADTARPAGAGLQAASSTVGLDGLTVAVAVVPKEPAGDNQPAALTVPVWPEAEGP